jgi:hypothetical protein
VNRQYTVEELLKILVHKEEELISLHCRNKSLEALLQLHNIAYDKDDLRINLDNALEEKDQVIESGQNGRKETMDKDTQTERSLEIRIGSQEKMASQAVGPDLGLEPRDSVEEERGKKEDEFKKMIYKENIELKGNLDKTLSELMETLEREKLLEESICRKDLRISQLEEWSLDSTSDSGKVFLKFLAWSDSNDYLETQLVKACHLYLNQKKAELLPEPLLTSVARDESTGESMTQVPEDCDIEIQNESTSEETGLQMSLQLLSKEYPELERFTINYLNALSKLDSQQSGNTGSLRETLSKQFIVKLVDSLLRLRQLLKGIPSTMHKVVAKLETVITAPPSPTGHNSSPFLDKIKQLEQQMESTQKEVGEYMKNCQMLKEMIQKQPESVNHEMAGKITEFNLKPVQGKLTSGLFSRGKQMDRDLSYKPSESSFSLSGSVLSNGVDHDPRHHLISNRSVIHSYLSRNPRILKHLKGGVKKEPLLIQDAEERPSWSLLSLLKKCCFVPEDRNIG